MKRLSADFLVVCGMPRSGTSLAGALFNTSPYVEVFNELPSLKEFPAAIEFKRQYLDWAGLIMGNDAEKWRGITPDVARRRSDDAILAICRAFKPVVPAEQRNSRWDWGVGEAAPVACFKKPNAELDIDFLEDVFAVRKPVYIYCVREPLRVYESILAVPWGPSYSPEHFVTVLEGSVRAVRELAAKSMRLQYLNISRLSQDKALRKKKLSRLFAELGLPMAWKTRRFMATWPPVNRARLHWGGKEFMAAREKEEWIRRVSELLQQRPDLRSEVDHMLQAGMTC